MANECIHYWIIESPSYNRRNFRSDYVHLGSWSNGKCKKCGMEKKFNNSNSTKEIDIDKEKERIKNERTKQNGANSLQDG